MGSPAMGACRMPGGSFAGGEGGVRTSSEAEKTNETKTAVATATVVPDNLRLEMAMRSGGRRSISARVSSAASFRSSSTAPPKVGVDRVLGAIQLRGDLRHREPGVEAKCDHLGLSLGQSTYQ